MIWAGGQRGRRREEKDKKRTMVAESDTRMGVAGGERGRVCSSPSDRHHVPCLAFTASRSAPRRLPTHESTTLLADDVAATLGRRNSP